MKAAIGDKTFENIFSTASPINNRCILPFGFTINITLTNKESQGKEKHGQSILLGTRDWEKMYVHVCLTGFS